MRFQGTIVSSLGVGHQKCHHGSKIKRLGRYHSMPPHKLALKAVALRQQLAIFKRKQPRPKLDRLDRMFWSVLRRLREGWSEALIIVKPETVVSCHRAGFHRFWRWRSLTDDSPFIFCGRSSRDATVQLLCCAGMNRDGRPVVDQSLEMSPWRERGRVLSLGVASLVLLSHLLDLSKVTGDSFRDAVTIPACDLQPHFSLRFYLQVEPRFLSTKWRPNQMFSRKQRNRDTRNAEIHWLGGRR